MYEEFYQFSSRPFQLTPDPDFYFESLTHRKALSYLGYGLAQGEGFIVITGEVGAGKTTLVGHLMATIDRARLTAANIVTSALDAEDVVALAAHHFGLEARGKDKSRLLGEFENFLHDEARAGRRCLLIVDEAQNLSTSALEELRMLSNFQLGGHPLLQIFLLGQPEFRDRYQKAPELEQLRQRVIANHHLGPMAADEVEPYILHRLTRAGWAGNPQLTGDAIAMIYDETLGIPRLINQLMSRILLMGSIEQRTEIDAELVANVLSDAQEDNNPVRSPSFAAAPAVATEEKADDSVLEWPREMSATTAPAPEADAPEAEVAEEKPRRKPAPTIENAVKTIAQVRQEAEEERAEQEALDGAIAHDPKLAARVDAMSQRLALLEERVQTSEDSLHRILTMLVDWVENDSRAGDHHVGTGRAA